MKRVNDMVEESWPEEPIFGTERTDEGVLSIITFPKATGTRHEVLPQQQQQAVAQLIEARHRTALISLAGPLGAVINKLREAGIMFLELGAVEEEPEDVLGEVTPPEKGARYIPDEVDEHERDEP